MAISAPNRIGYVDMSTGVSGDMFVGAMIDAGFPLSRIQEALHGLGLEGVRVEARRVTRCGLGGTKFDVVEEGKGHTPLSSSPDLGRRQGADHRSHPHGSAKGRRHEVGSHGRHFTEIAEMIEGCGLPAPVRRNAVETFRILGEAESHLHNTTLEGVHFHEVGAVDSIVDVVAACLAVHDLAIDRLYSSEVPLCGGGTVTFSHGIVALPAPATLEILRGIPTRTSDLKTELVTPTGAALLRVLCSGFGPRPDMVVESVGYGAGTKDFPDRPNLVRICIGRPLEGR